MSTPNRDAPEPDPGASAFEGTATPAARAGAADGVGAHGRDHHRVAIVGAGFAGIGAAIRLKQAGIDDIVVLERAGDVGGTWQANTYPGCQCDIPSHLYSYSFAPNPDWSRTYSLQPEIWEYLQRVAREHDVERHVRLRCEVNAARWDEGARRWLLQTTGGELTADLLITGVGQLCEPKLPEIEGIERFAGTSMHSARWEREHSLAGERVAVIGTGASAIQIVPRVQRKLAGTVWNTGGCASWYFDANGKNTVIWPGPTLPYRWRMRRFDPDHYELSPRSPVAPASSVPTRSSPAGLT